MMFGIQLWSYYPSLYLYFLKCLICFSIDTSWSDLASVIGAFSVRLTVPQLEKPSDGFQQDGILLLRNRGVFLFSSPSCDGSSPGPSGQQGFLHFHQGF